MRKRKKAALLFFILPFSLRKKISRHLNRKERTVLENSMKKITRRDIKDLQLVLNEFTSYMLKVASREKTIRGQKVFPERVEIFVLFLLLIFWGCFFLFYKFGDQARNMMQAGFFHIILTILIFTYMLTEYHIDVFKRWYSGDRLFTSIILGVLFSGITSILMIIDNRLFIEVIVELHGIFFIANLVTAVIFGPFIEELIFRGVVIDTFSKIFGKALSMLLSAVIFSLVHFPGNFVDFLLVFLVGLCFGILYASVGNLISSTVAHSITNIAVFIFIR